MKEECIKNRVMTLLHGKIIHTANLNEHLPVNNFIQIPGFIERVNSLVEYRYRSDLNIHQISNKNISKRIFIHAEISYL